MRSPFSTQLFSASTPMPMEATPFTLNTSASAPLLMSTPTRIRKPSLDSSTDPAALPPVPVDAPSESTLLGNQAPGLASAHTRSLSQLAPGSPMGARSYHRDKIARHGRTASASLVLLQSLDGEETGGVFLPAPSPIVPGLSKLTRLGSSLRLLDAHAATDELLLNMQLESAEDMAEHEVCTVTVMFWHLLRMGQLFWCTVSEMHTEKWPV